MLSQLAFVPGVHPWEAYSELTRLVGQLSIFGRDARPPELPRYDHDDLGGGFWKLKQYIDAMLNDVEDPAYEERPFIGSGLRMQVAWSRLGSNRDGRCFSASARTFPVTTVSRC